LKIGAYAVAFVPNVSARKVFLMGRLRTAIEKALRASGVELNVTVTQSSTRNETKMSITNDPAIRKAIAAFSRDLSEMIDRVAVEISETLLREAKAKFDLHHSNPPTTPKRVRKSRAKASKPKRVRNRARKTARKTVPMTEREIALRALARADGNVSEASRETGMTRKKIAAFRDEQPFSRI